MITRKRTGNISLLLLAVSLGCSGMTAEEAAVRRVAAMRADALNSRNHTLYCSLISPRYSYQGKDFPAVKKQLEEAFASAGKVSYRCEKLDVEVRGEKAVIRGNYSLRMSGTTKEFAVAGEENLLLAKENGMWKIVGGL